MAEAHGLPAASQAASARSAQPWPVLDHTYSRPPLAIENKRPPPTSPPNPRRRHAILTAYRGTSALAETCSAGQPARSLTTEFFCPRKPRRPPPSVRLPFACRPPDATTTSAPAELAETGHPQKFNSLIQKVKLDSSVQKNMQPATNATLHNHAQCCTVRLRRKLSAFSHQRSAWKPAFCRRYRRSSEAHMVFRE